MQCALADLPSHPQPINKAAGLSVSHKPDKEHLLNQQRETLARALKQARLRNMREDRRRILEIERIKDPRKRDAMRRSWEGVVAAREKIFCAAQEGGALRGRSATQCWDGHGHLSWRY